MKDHIKQKNYFQSKFKNQISFNMKNLDYLKF